MQQQSNNLSKNQNLIISIKLLLTIILLCVFSIPASKSSNKKPFVVYDFIRMDANKLHVYNDSILFNSFIKKLKRLEEKGEGKVEILHIGDSHIQADLFSGWVRESFYDDDRFPMESRGFFFPYKAAKTNNPYNFSISKVGNWQGKRASISYHKSEYGLAGITARTKEKFASLTVDISVDSLRNFKGNRIEIYYPTEDKTQFDPQVIPFEHTNLLEVKKENGRKIFIFDTAVSKFQLAFKKEESSQNNFLIRGIRVSNTRANEMVYSSSGVNGATVKTYLKCKDLEYEFNTLNPDLLIISLGTNDAFHSLDKKKFKENYKKLISRIRASNPSLPIILTTPGDNFRKSKYLNKDNVRASEVIYALAKEEDLVVWDFYQVMGGLGSIEKWSSLSMTAKDRVHLNKYGYQYQGKLFYKAFTDYYDSIKGNVYL